MLEHVGARTGMSDAVLREIAEHLRGFAERETPHQIDLRSLPMSSADRAELIERLGEGEVKATVAVVGDSEIRETAYAGVWWVRHLGRSGDVLAEFIEITEVPSLLRAQREDVADAAARLRDELQANQRGEEDHG